VLVGLGGCSEAVPGNALGSAPPPSSFAGQPGATAELASTGPRIATPKKADGSACAIATQQQVSAALGPVTGAPAPLRGNAGSCVWPLDTGGRDGFLIGYGLAYEDVSRMHPATPGAFGRETDGNSTWLWCDVSDQSGAFTCGAAVAISADKTFVTGLVRSPGAGRTRTSVLTELQPITIALFRSLPGL
jgi:hypothetical protein